MQLDPACLPMDLRATFSSVTRLLHVSEQERGPSALSHVPCVIIFERRKILL
jgi:hypothetical protein